MVISEVKKENCKKCNRCKNEKVGSHPVAVRNSSTKRRQLITTTRVNDVPPITDRPINLLRPFAERLFAELEYCALEEKIEYGDLTVNSILNRPFYDVGAILRQLDVSFNTDLIRETLLHFSLVIYGLPVCQIEDLLLAVYIFIEDAFDIKSKIPFCAKLCEYDGKMNVGVVFDTIQMKYNVLKNDALLEGTEVRLKDNKEMSWIMKSMFCNSFYSRGI